MAAEAGGVLLLTNGNAAHPTVDGWLREHPVATTFAVGGDATEAYPAVQPVVGSTPAEEAVVASNAIEFAGMPVIVTDADFADALTATSLSGPLYFTAPQALSQPTADALTNTRPPSVVALGGPAAISSTTRRGVDNVLRAP